MHLHAYAASMPAVLIAVVALLAELLPHLMCAGEQQVCVCVCYIHMHFQELTLLQSYLQHFARQCICMPRLL